MSLAEKQFVGRFICRYVYIYIYVCIYVYVNVYIYICTYIYIYVYIYTYMYIYIYISAAPARHGAWCCCMHHVTRENEICHTYASMGHITGGYQ